jgi:hypothetical protein
MAIEVVRKGLVAIEAVLKEMVTIGCAQGNGNNRLCSRKGGNRLCARDWWQ